jgi:hypothetical protein
LTYFFISRMCLANCPSSGSDSIQQQPSSNTPDDSQVVIGSTNQPLIISLAIVGGALGIGALILFILIYLHRYWFLFCFFCWLLLHIHTPRIQKGRNIHTKLCLCLWVLIAIDCLFVCLVGWLVGWLFVCCIDKDESEKFVRKSCYEHTKLWIVQDMVFIMVEVYSQLRKNGPHPLTLRKSLPTDN